MAAPSPDGEKTPAIPSPARRRSPARALPSQPREARCGRGYHPAAIVSSIPRTMPALNTPTRSRPRSSRESGEVQLPGDAKTVIGPAEALTEAVGAEWHQRLEDDGGLLAGGSGAPCRRARSPADDYFSTDLYKSNPDAPLCHAGSGRARRRNQGQARQSTAQGQRCDKQPSVASHRTSMVRLSRSMRFIRDHYDENYLAGY